MATKKKRTGIEWVGGLISMPAFVTGEGDPYRPEALFWMGAEGAVLGHTVGRPGELVGSAICASLRRTIESPIFGKPHAPQRVRVASPELAEALRAGHPGIDVVCAPTPELDPVFAGMRAGLKADAETEPSYLSPEIDPAAVAALFRAAAGLFRAKPWTIVPSDEDVFSITIKTLGVEDAVLSVIGQAGQSLGFILFSSIDDFEDYLEAADAMEQGEDAVVPPHFALNFERGADLDPALRKEIAQHHWEVAATDAYPWLVPVDDDLLVLPLTADHVTIAEAIALALPKMLNEKAALLAAWNGGEPVARTLSVRTHAGDVEVSLRVPCEHAPVDLSPPYDVFADLLEIGQIGEAGDEIESAARGPLENELVRRFEISPEAKALSKIRSCRYVMNYAADYFGDTIATLGPERLREILFEIVPSKVSVRASAANGIVEELRAFYAFLKRAFGFKQADACLRVLGGDAAKKLEAALSDPRNFGPAKSLVMGGFEAGFDMESQEGIDAWMRVMQARSIPLPSKGGPSQPVNKAALRAKKGQRKAARKARKKNR